MPATSGLPDNPQQIFVVSSCGQVDVVPPVRAGTDPTTTRAESEPQTETGNRRLMGVLSTIVLWLFSVAVAIGGGAIVRSDIKRRHQERIEAANTEVREAVKVAAGWIRQGKAKDGEDVEQRLMKAIAANDVSERANADAVLERVRTRRAELAADSNVDLAKIKLDAKEIDEAVTLLHRYVADRHATKKPEAEQLLADYDLATSQSAAIDTLVAMSDERFAQFRNTGKLDDHRVTHPILVDIRATTLRRNVETADRRREEKKIAEAKRQESERLARDARKAAEKANAEKMQLIATKMVGIWHWGPGNSMNEMRFAKDGAFVEAGPDGWAGEGQWRVEKDGTIRLSHAGNYSAVIAMNLNEEKISVALTYPSGGGWQAEGRKIQGTWNWWHDEKETRRYVALQVQSIQQELVDPTLRRQAVDNLTELGRAKCPVASHALSLLVKVVANDGDRLLRRKAIEAISEMGQSAGIPPIAQTLLQKRDPEMAKAAEDALVKLLPAVGSLNRDEALLLWEVHRLGNKRLSPAIERAWAVGGIDRDSLTREMNGRAWQARYQRMTMGYEAFGFPKGYLPPWEIWRQAHPAKAAIELQRAAAQIRDANQRLGRIRFKTPPPPTEAQKAQERNDAAGRMERARLHSQPR